MTRTSLPKEDQVYEISANKYAYRMKSRQHKVESDFVSIGRVSSSHYLGVVGPYDSYLNDPFIDPYGSNTVLGNVPGGLKDNKILRNNLFASRQYLDYYNSKYITFFYGFRIIISSTDNAFKLDPISILYVGRLAFGGAETSGEVATGTFDSILNSTAYYDKFGNDVKGEYTGVYDPGGFNGGVNAINIEANSLSYFGNSSNVSHIQPSFGYSLVFSLDRIKKGVVIYALCRNVMDKDLAWAYNKKTSFYNDMAKDIVTGDDGTSSFYISAANANTNPMF